MLRAGFGYFADNPSYVTLMRREAIDGGAHLGIDLAAVLRPMFDQAADYLGREMDAGVLRHQNPQQLLLTGYGALLSYFSDAPFLEGLLDEDPLAPAALDRRSEHIIEFFHAALDAVLIPVARGQGSDHAGAPGQRYRGDCMATPQTTSDGPDAHTTLSERDSKALLAEYGIPIAAERVVGDAAAAGDAADELGYPVVAKLNGDAIAHKTERGLVKLRLTDRAAVEAAAADLLAAATPADGEVSVLIAPMISGNRELIAGVVRDPQFGPTVMLGVGGILAEAVADVVFRPAPVDSLTAAEMIDDLATQKLLGAFRGEAAVERSQLVDVIVGLGRLAAERADVASVDINPLIVQPDGSVVAVDGLVELGAPSTGTGHTSVRPRPTDEQFRALFDPEGVLVTGASTHPGKFGFVSLHNLLASGYAGGVYGTNLKGEEVLGVQTVADIAELPDDSIDLVFVCTPAAANPDLLRACAAKGIRAAFLTSAGYGEAGDEGQRAEDELVALADELGILLAGPNGQGVVSTPVNLCAQIVAPYPPAGGIGVASQSGNFVSSFMNLSRASGVGISRAVSAGNAAAVTVADYLDWYADDPATSVGLAYVEGIVDGRGLMDRLAGAAARKPLVLVKGGATEGGAQAAASHTGALAANDKIFDGECRAAGITRAATVTEAFEAAATFATQPLPSGPNTIVLTTVWWLGCGDRRCHHPRPRPRPHGPARRPAGGHRHEAAAPLEPEQPRRLRRWRGPRHDPRGDGADRRTPRRRRDDLPRPRHPEQPGAA